MNKSSLAEITNQPGMVGEVSVTRLSSLQVETFTTCLAAEGVARVSDPFTPQWRLQVINCIEKSNLVGLVGIKIYSKSAREKTNAAMTRVMDCLKAKGHKLETLDLDWMLGWKAVDEIPEKIVEECERASFTRLDSN